MKKQSANKILWVEYWINQVSQDYEEFQLSAEELSNKKWECLIEIPLINEIVVARSSKEVNAMLIAANKASKLIDEFFINHPALKIENPYKYNHYIILGDENGRFKSIELENKHFKKILDKDAKNVSKTFEEIRKTINRIKKNSKTNKSLFIQVFDKSILKEDQSIDGLIKKLSAYFRKEYGYRVDITDAVIDDENVIIVGYASNKEDEISIKKAIN